MMPINYFNAFKSIEGRIWVGNKDIQFLYTYFLPLKARSKKLCNYGESSKSLAIVTYLDEGIECLLLLGLEVSIHVVVQLVPAGREVGSLDEVGKTTVSICHTLVDVRPAALNQLVQAYLQSGHCRALGRVQYVCWNRRLGLRLRWLVCHLWQEFLKKHTKSAFVTFGSVITVCFK